MLGCILYCLCFGKHPFQDSQKLAIINAQYFIPVFEAGSQDLTSERLSDNMKDLIRFLLTPNPEKRPTIDELEFLIKNFHSLKEIQLNDDALEIKKKHLEFERVQMKRVGIPYSQKA